MTGAFGRDGFGTTPYGSSLLPFSVSGALPLSQTFVQVQFSDLIDPSYGPMTVPSNYVITPPLAVHAAQVYTATSIRLMTDPQADTLYTLQVTQARSYSGAPLDPFHNSALFWGVAGFATFFAVGTARRRIRLIFEVEMRNVPDLVDPLNYSVQTVSGALVSIDGVVAEGSAPMAVTLTTSSDLQPGQFYNVTVSSNVRSATGQVIWPDDAVFQYNEVATQIGRSPLVIPFSSFSGEVTDDPMLGDPAGLVYFSPALEASAQDSVIQVDEVSVCTRAFDKYVIPQPVDPTVLYTYGPGHDEGIGGAVLWAPFPRLAEARFEMRDLREETMPLAVDSRCIATFREPWDPAYVSLLNNTHWKLYDGGVTPPAYFICADNLAPIPPGPTVVIVLEP